jgi:chemotaxis protein methyltransferase CheR
VDLIGRASERIAVLARKQTQQNQNLGSAAAEDTATLRDLALKLVMQERYDEAREVLQRHVGTEDPDMLLLQALLFTNAGQLREAERVCEKLLHLDEMSAGAHYLMALCREHSGDVQQAEEHDTMAVYLDPSFAMPHLHLGVLAKRQGQIERARYELGQAVGLLDREDSSRVLLFGGGFSRQSLIELCRAQIRACGAGNG